ARRQPSAGALLRGIPRLLRDVPAQDRGAVRAGGRRAGADVHRQREVSRRARRDAPRRQSAADRPAGRTHGRGRGPHRDGTRRRARAWLSGQYRGVPHHRERARLGPGGNALRRGVARAAIAVMIALAPTVVASESATSLRFSDLYTSSGPLGIAFSESAERLRGQPVRMTGYLAPPLRAEASFFVLCAQPVSICPFCQSDADWPQDIVVVYPHDSAWRFRSAAARVEVIGTLDLGSKLDPTTGFVSQVRLLSALVRRG